MAIYFSFVGVHFAKYKAGDVIDGDDVVPPYPSIFTYFSIHGEDVDKDGVRDDYEWWVNENFNEIDLRRAIKYNAKMMTKVMNAETKQDLEQAMIELIESGSCLNGLVNSEKYPNHVLDVSDNFIQHYGRGRYMNRNRHLLTRDVHTPMRVSKVNFLKKCKIEFKDLEGSLSYLLKDDLYKEKMPKQEIVEFEQMLGIENE